MIYTKKDVVEMARAFGVYSKRDALEMTLCYGGLVFAAGVLGMVGIAPALERSAHQRQFEAAALAPATEIVAQGTCKTDPVIKHEQDGKLTVTLPPGCTIAPK